MQQDQRKDVGMAERSRSGSSSHGRYERLIRGEITSKQYVKSLKSDASSQRSTVKSAKTRRTPGGA